MVNLQTFFRYRSKYLRLKSRTDELSTELAREKERVRFLIKSLEIMASSHAEHMVIQPTDRHQRENGSA